MCDTQVAVTRDGVWFAKNSDREPDEPQPVIRIPAIRDDDNPVLETTYLRIDQVPDRNAVMLSKPLWCWGAEMGINEHGVCIGNEAIFSRCTSSEPALLGMDLVRLGLERADSAEAAVNVITGLLERHGQGGPAGYHDKSFHYDNSFIVADPREAWVLETAGRDWAAKRVQSAYAISNALTLGKDYDLASERVSREQLDFARTFDSRLMPTLAGAHRRRALGMHCLGAARDHLTFRRMAMHLRMHGHRSDDPIKGSNADVCMHAAGPVRRSQTTGSMIARLKPAGQTVVFTGTSAPCLSIYRPAAFSGQFSVLAHPEEQDPALFWRQHEHLHRMALGDRGLRGMVRQAIDQYEKTMFEYLAAPVPDIKALQAADRLAMEWQEEMLTFAASREPPSLHRFWRRVSRRDGIEPDPRSVQL